MIIRIDPATLRTYAEAEATLAEIERAARHAAARHLVKVARKRAARQAARQAAPQGFTLPPHPALARTMAPRAAAPYSGPKGERTCIGRPQVAPAPLARQVKVQARPRPQAARPRRPQVKVAPRGGLTLGAALRLALAPLALILAFYGWVARGGLRLIGWGRLAR